MFNTASRVVFGVARAEAGLTNSQAHDPNTNVQKELHHIKVWRKVCSRIAFSAVTVTTGDFPLTGCEAADALRAYRAHIFKAKLVDTAAENQLLTHIPENQLGVFSGPPESFAYLLLQGKRDTAPGPDGLRYAAWYHAGRPFWNAPEAHAHRTFDGARLPQSNRTGPS